MKNHLTRRGGMWWARLVVPERLRAVAARREFVQSCKTHELKIAKAVAAALVADWRRQLLALESRAMSIDILKFAHGASVTAMADYVSVGEAAAVTGLSVIEIMRAAASRQLKLHCRLAWGRGMVMPMGELELERVIITKSGKLVRQGLPPRVPTRTEMPDDAYADGRNGVIEVFLSSELAQEAIAGGLEAVTVQLFSQPYDGIICSDVFVLDTPIVVPVERLEVRVAEINALRGKAAAIVPPEHIEHARAALKASVEGTPAASAGKWARRLFSDAVDDYCKSPDGLPGSLASEIDQRQRKAGLMLFAEFMGDLRLSDIDGDVLRAFRDGPLKTIPGRANTLPKAIKRDTMKATIEALHADGREWPRLSSDMQHERMQWLARVFAWLCQKGYLSTNPAAALHGETGQTKAERIAAKHHADDEDETGREPFTEGQLKAIFGQLHYVHGHGRHVRKPGCWYGFEYWLPLLGLYAGLRIKEASQLHLSDVRQDAGIWVLDINRRTVDKSLKNAQSQRTIPLHPELVRLGFPAYCARLLDRGFRRVFPELTWSKSNAKYGKEPGRKMSAMLKKLGMRRDGTLVFHCLRHNANNALMRVPVSVLPGADEHLKKFIRLRIMGHEPGEDVNTRHYTRTTAAEMAALVAGVAHGLPPIKEFDIDFAMGQIDIALEEKAGFRHGREDLGPLNDELYGPVT